MGEAIPKTLVDKFAIVSFLIPLFVYILSLEMNKGPQGQHVINVFTQYALWKTGYPGLGTVRNPIVPNLSQYGDIIISHGKYFSVYSPGTAYLSLPFSVIGFLLNNGKLLLDSSAILTDEVFVALCAALSSLILYKICRMYACPIPSLLASFTLAFGTIAWPFATVIFDHDVAMLFSLLAVYCMLRFSEAGDLGSKKYLLIAATGMSLAIASTVEYLSALLIVPLFAFVAYRRKLSIKSGSVFVLSFIVGPLLDLAYNWLVTGNPLIFPENFWRGANGAPAFSRFDFSQLMSVTIYNLLSPYRGLLLISPVLLFGVYGFIRMYQSKIFRADGLLFLSLFLFGLIPYSAWTPWMAGGSFGPRFLIDVIPYLVIPISYVLSENRAVYTRAIFYALFLVSSFIEGAAAFTLATPSYPPQAKSNFLFYYQPIYRSIPLLLGNKIDAWWFASQPSYVIFIIPLCFLLIWSAAAYFLILPSGWRARHTSPLEVAKKIPLINKT